MDSPDIPEVTLSVLHDMLTVQETTEKLCDDVADAELSLLSLPRELWTRVLRFLRHDLRTLARLELVSRRVRWLTHREGWGGIRHLSLTFFALRDHTRALRINGETIDMLRQSAESPDYYYDYQQSAKTTALLRRLLHLGRLESLSLVTAGGHVADCWLRGRPKACPLASKLLRCLASRLGDPRSRHRLKALDYRNGVSPGTSYGHVEAALPALLSATSETLSCLSIRPIPGSTWHGLKRLCSKVGAVAHLRSLSLCLEGNDVFNGEALSLALDSPELCELALSGCDRINARHLKAPDMAAVFARLRPKLRRLQIKGSMAHRSSFLSSYASLVAEGGADAGLGGVEELVSWTLESRTELGPFFAAFPALKVVHADYAEGGSEGTDRSWNVGASAAVAAEFLKRRRRGSRESVLELRISSASPIEHFERLADDFAEAVSRADPWSQKEVRATVVVSKRKAVGLVGGVHWVFRRGTAAVDLRASTVCNSSNGFSTTPPPMPAPP